MRRMWIRNAAQLIAAMICTCAAITKELDSNHGAALAFTIAALCFLSYALFAGKGQA